MRKRYWFRAGTEVVFGDCHSVYYVVDTMGWDEVLIAPTWNPNQTVKLKINEIFPAKTHYVEPKKQNRWKK